MDEAVAAQASGDEYTRELLFSRAKNVPFFCSTERNERQKGGECVNHGVFSPAQAVARQFFAARILYYLYTRREYI